MKKITLKIPICYIASIFIIIGCKNKENESSKTQETQEVLDSLKINEESLNQTLNWSWAKGATGTIKSGDVLDKEGKSVITDSKGYVYVVGDFHGETIAFDNIVSNKIGEGWNSFFTKYDSEGNVIWVKVIKEYNNTTIAIDSKDDIYISCDGHFISKYNTEGKKIWEKNTTMTEISIAVKSPNSFYLVGTTNYPSKSIVKYDSMGNILWSKELKTIDNYGEERGLLQANIEVDSIGSIYISGNFSSAQLKFGDKFLNREGINYYSMGSTNGFLMKCDVSGNLIWAKNIGASNRYNLTTFGKSITNNEGDIYVVGWCDGNLTIGSISIDSHSAFLIKYNKNGDILWIRSISNCGASFRIEAIAINKFGNIYICGSTPLACQSLSIGKFNETTTIGNVSFIAKYNPNGDELCTKSIKYLSSSEDKVISWCNDITVDKSGSVYITGRYEGGSLQFGNSILSKPQEDHSFFLAKLSLEKTQTISSQKDNSVNQNTNNANNNNSNSIKQFDDIQLTLTDASLKKAKIFLGEPDKYEYGFGHVTKGFAIYYNKVSNQNGSPKHLVLFLRMNGYQWGDNAEILEIYSVEDNQKVCFGIHCIKIKNQKISTNALDLIDDRGYESMN